MLGCRPFDCFFRSAGEPTACGGGRDFGIHRYPARHHHPFQHNLRGSGAAHVKSGPHHCNLWSMFRIPLNLLLLAENRNSIPLVMGAAALAVLSSFGAWRLNGSKVTREKRITNDNVRTPTGAQNGAEPNPQITPDKAHEQRQQSAEEVKTEVQGAAKAPQVSMSRDLSHSASLPPFVLWSLGLLIGGVALAPSGFYIMLKFRNVGGGPIGISAMIIGGLLLVFGLLCCLWRLYEIKRRRVPAIGRRALMVFTLPTLGAVMFGVIAFSISEAEKIGWHFPGISRSAKVTSPSSPDDPGEAMRVLLEAARNRNSRVFREGLTQSFREVIDHQGNGPDDVGDFDKVKLISAARVNDHTALIVVESTDDSKRRVTFLMKREDGKWKLDPSR